MRKYYSEPALEVRKYLITDIFTESEPGLHDGDDYNLDAVGAGEDVFGDE